MARYPTDRVRVTPHGGYLYVRTGPGKGSCAGRGYPCVHKGLDLAGEAGTPVRAPEPGVAVWWGDGTEKPGTGYGPSWVIFRGASGAYHMLAHLDLVDLRRRMADIDLPIHEYRPHVTPDTAEGAQLGVTSTADHVHWEPRDTVTGPSMDPAAWLAGARAGDVGFLAELRANMQQVPTRVPSGTAAVHGPGAGALLVLALLLMED